MVMSDTLPASNLEHELASFCSQCGIFFANRTQKFFLALPGTWSEINKLPGNSEIAQPLNTVILIAGGEVRIQIQVFFSLRLARESIQGAFRHTMENISKNSCIDFVEEWTNQLAGGLKSTLIEQGLHLGHSLPVTYPSYCNALQEPTQGHDAHWEWKINERQSFFVKLSLLGDPKAYAGIGLGDDALKPCEDEIEFL